MKSAFLAALLVSIVVGMLPAEAQQAEPRVRIIKIDPASLPAPSPI